MFLSSVCSFLFYINILVTVVPCVFMWIKYYLLLSSFARCWIFRCNFKILAHSNQTIICTTIFLYRNANLKLTIIQSLKKEFNTITKRGEERKKKKKREEENIRKVACSTLAMMHVNKINFNWLVNKSNKC